MASFFTNDTQKSRIGVGLGRIVHAEAGEAGKPQKITAALTEDGFIIDIQRCPVHLHQIKRSGSAEETNAVCLFGADV